MCWDKNTYSVGIHELFVVPPSIPPLHAHLPPHQAFAAAQAANLQAAFGGPAAAAAAAALFQGPSANGGSPGGAHAPPPPLPPGKKAHQTIFMAKGFARKSIFSNYEKAKIIMGLT